LSLIFSNILRYLRIISKYRFELVVEAGYLIAMMIAFGFIGYIFLDSDSTILPYSFQKFIVVNIFVWAFMEKGYLEATRIIPEEARLGTLGTLLNNNVSPLTLIVSQMAARSILNGFVAVLVFVPVFMYLGVGSMDLVGMVYLAAVLLLSWLYMLTVAILIGSLALLFKKIGPTAGVFLQLFKVGSGFFFPVETLRNVGWPFTFLPAVLRIIPVTRGLEVARDIIILGKVPDGEGALLSISGVSLDPIVLMVAGVVAGLFISVGFYRYIERKSMKLGMVEHY
jgi:ABC-type polysaccharide/polyol phosphate export permease